MEDLARLVEPLDWFDEEGYLYWQPFKAEVRFDCRLLVEVGLNGAWVEKELAGRGIVVYARLIWIKEDMVIAGILVDRTHERRVCQWLAKLGVLV